jgi:hypothetical protein
MFGFESGKYHQKAPNPLALGIVSAWKADDGARRYGDFGPVTDLRAPVENARTRSRMVALGAYSLQLSFGGSFVANDAGVDLGWAK